MSAAELINELNRISIKAEHKDLGHIRVIASEAADMLRQIQDKLDIETAYNQVHIEQIEALKSDAEKLTMRLIDIAVTTPQTKPLQQSVIAKIAVEIFGEGWIIANTRLEKYARAIEAIVRGEK